MVGIIRKRVYSKKFHFLKRKYFLEEKQTIEINWALNYSLSIILISFELSWNNLKMAFDFVETKF